jgi:3-dehydroquinate synthase
MVSSSSGPYAIRLGNGIREQIPDLLQTLGFPQNEKIGLISNETVRVLHANALSSRLEKKGYPVVNFDFHDGESYKTMDSVMSCLEKLLSVKWERKNPLIVLGGGVTGDMGGFVGSVLLRGVPVIHVPTTVVGQVDSSIGGKTGVDHSEGKNLIGSFYPPKAVWIDPSYLETLSLRERRSGLGEVIKYAMIGDKNLLEFLDAALETLASKNFDREVWEKAIFYCASDKARIVSEDEKESGIRMNLNFGHTFGHALERATGYQGLLHGEAVGLGMIVAARIGTLLGITEKGTEEIIVDFLQQAHLPCEWPKEIAYRDLDRYLRNDKKSSSGMVTLVLPVRPGEVVRTNQYEPSVLGSAIP